MRTFILVLLFGITLSSTSCSKPDSVEAETELFSPGDDGEVKEKPGDN